MILAGPFTAEQWAWQRNLPVSQIRVGSVVTLFGYGGQSVVFVACQEAQCESLPFSPLSFF